MSKNKSRKKQSRSVWGKTMLLLLGCCAVNLPLAYAEDYIGDYGKWLTIFDGEKREYDNVIIREHNDTSSLIIYDNASLTVKKDLTIDKYDSRSSGISYGLTADGTESTAWMLQGRLLSGLFIPVMGCMQCMQMRGLV